MATETGAPISVNVVFQQRLLPKCNILADRRDPSQTPPRTGRSFTGISGGIHIKQTTTVVAVDDLSQRQFDLELRRNLDRTRGAGPLDDLSHRPGAGGLDQSAVLFGDVLRQLGLRLGDGVLELLSLLVQPGFDSGNFRRNPFLFLLSGFPFALDLGDPILATLNTVVQFEYLVLENTVGDRVCVDLAFDCLLYTSPSPRD